MSRFVEYIEVCPILTCITLVSFHAYTICLQDNGLFQKRNIRVENMKFPGVEKMKICGIHSRFQEFKNKLENGWNSHR